MENLLNGGLSSSLTSMLTSILTSLPTFIVAILIIIIGNIIAKVVAKTVQKLLSKVGIDKLGEQLNEIDLVQNLNTDIKISSIFSKIIYYFLLFIFIITATDILNMQAISELVMNAFNMIPKIVVALIILIFGTLMAEGIKKVVLAALQSMAIPSAKIIASILFYFLFINVAISAIAQADINTAFLEQNISIIIGGAVMAFAIGYGLASKETVANFLGSFYTEPLFNIGDKITIGEDTGVVKEMDRNSVKIDVEGNEVIYPLGILMKQKLTLYSKK